MNSSQAYASVEAGRAVGGYTPNGEIQIAKTKVMVNERGPTEKCGYEYDSYTRENEYKCETVYETKRVPKTVYLVSGPRGRGTTQRDNVAGAFAYAAEYRVTAWRLAN